MADPDSVVTRPVARSDLELVEAPDGLIVYDETTDRVHHLNQTAAVILELCDGTQTVDEIAVSFGRMFGNKEAPLQVARECIAHLERERLIQERP